MPQPGPAASIVPGHGHEPVVLLDHRDGVGAAEADQQRDRAGAHDLEAEEVSRGLAERDVWILPAGPGRLRAVTQLILGIICAQEPTCTKAERSRR